MGEITWFIVGWIAGQFFLAFVGSWMAGAGPEIAVMERLFTAFPKRIYPDWIFIRRRR